MEYPYSREVRIIIGADELLPDTGQTPLLRGSDPLGAVWGTTPLGCDAALVAELRNDHEAMFLIRSGR